MKSAYGRQTSAPDYELTCVEPGSPMGELMRRYWQPVCTSDELRDLPRKEKLLCEDIVVFRDKKGRVGALDPHCAHRGTSLEWGRVEEEGLRCCYHGWLYDTQGQCIDMPCETEEFRKAMDVWQPAYPVTEYGGLVFVYMGPPGTEPLFPRFDIIDLAWSPETVIVSDFYIHLPDLVSSIPISHEWFGKTSAELYRLLADKYLRVRPEIVAEIDAFDCTHMRGAEPIIAVHYRGTDKVVETDFMPSHEIYFDLIDRDAADWRIFLLTDEAQCIEGFLERYGSRVTFTNAIRSSSKIPVHLSRAADRVRLGADVLKDVHLALRCQKFIGLGMSNPSCIISVLKDWCEGDCILLGPSLLRANFTRN